MSPQAEARRLGSGEITISGECAATRQADLTPMGVTGKNRVAAIGDKGIENSLIRRMGHADGGNGLVSALLGTIFAFAELLEQAGETT